MMDLELEITVSGSVNLEKYSYGVVMVLIDAQRIVRAITALQESINPDHLMAKGLEEESHVTVRFGFSGDTKDMVDYLRKQKPFTLTLGKTIAFDPTENSDNASPIVVEVKITPELYRMNEELKSVGTWKAADFEYHPHMTLAYVKPEFAEQYTGLDLLDEMSLVISEAVVNTADEERIAVPFEGTSKSLPTVDSVHINKPLGVDDDEDDLFLELTKFNENHDDLGRFSSGEGGGIEFVSPNTAEGLTFHDAVSRLGSSEHEHVRQGFQKIDKSLGLNTVHTNAIGDWSDGAENSVMVEAKNVSYDQLKYSAALKGSAADQKGVIIFKTQKGGPDSMYSFHATGKLEKIREKLDAAGLQFRTLIPEHGGARVVIFDKGSELKSSIESKIGEHYGPIDIALRSGHGDFLGGDTRDDAQKAYREVITAWEKSHAGGRNRGSSRYGYAGPGSLTVAPQQQAKKGLAIFDLFLEFTKFNENHDEMGRFSSGDGGGGGSEPSSGGTDSGGSASHVPRSDRKLTSEQRDVETSFAKQLAANPAAAIHEYRQRFGNVISADSVKELSADFRRDPTTYSEAVHEPSSWLAKKMYAEELAKSPGKDKLNTVLFTAGGTGAGKSSALEGVDSLAYLTRSSQIVYDSTFSTYKGAADKIDQALAAGKNVVVVYTHRDPIEAMINGVVPRALSSGRVTPVSVHADSHLLSRETIGKLSRKYDGNSKVSIEVIDNSFGLGKAKLSSLSAIPKISKPYSLKTRLLATLKEAHTNGKVTAHLYEHIRKFAVAFA